MRPATTAPAATCEEEKRAQKTDFTCGGGNGNGSSVLLSHLVQVPLAAA
jgi:hypothetical protein